MTRDWRDSIYTENLSGEKGSFFLQFHSSDCSRTTSFCSSIRLRVEHLPPDFAQYLIVLQYTPYQMRCAYRPPTDRLDTLRIS